MFDNKLKETISLISPLRVFDVGVGMGKIGNIVKEISLNCFVEGCEIHEDYLETYKERHSVYSLIHPKSIISIIKTLDSKYDLVVFGDVIEHLFFSQVYDVLDFFQYRSRFIIIITPLSSCQSAWEGHIHERHVSDVKLTDISSRYNILEYVKKTENGYTKCFYLLRGIL